MSKLIVTHVSPDFDGIPAIWLFKKFHPDFKNARVAFVPAGSTFNNQPVDSDPDIVHVDTGLGKFDHHQSNEFTCGAQKVYEYLVDEGYVVGDEALERVVKVLTEMDHGWDNYKWPEPASDRNEFLVHNALSGLRLSQNISNEQAVEWASAVIEAIYRLMQSKVKAEGEIKRGKEFTTPWGKAVAVLSGNSTILDLAIKMGYALTLTKDPVRGNVRITGSNVAGVDLTRAYEQILKKDSEGTWFLHSSKVLLRNGSSRNPTMKPTKLNLEQIVEVLEKA